MCIHQAALPFWDRFPVPRAEAKLLKESSKPPPRARVPCIPKSDTGFSVRRRPDFRPVHINAWHETLRDQAIRHRSDIGLQLEVRLQLLVRHQRCLLHPWHCCQARLKAFQVLSDGCDACEVGRSFSLWLPKSTTPLKKCRHVHFSPLLPGRSGN